MKKHGIEFASVGGDPAELMQMCVDNGMFTISFMKEGLQKVSEYPCSNPLLTWQFRGWLDDLLNSSWEACQNTDLLIESPSAMGGIHIAEALRIPYFRAFTVSPARRHLLSTDEADAVDAYSRISACLCRAGSQARGQL